jgi:hypothetical protein
LWQEDLAVVITLSTQQRQSLETDARPPVPVVDEQGQMLYYLLSAEQFEKVRALLVEEEFDPRDVYPLIAKTAGEAGWNDPAMDAYDNYDEQRGQG